MSQVALIQGNNRYDNIRQALDRISDDLDLSAKHHVLIKPNFVVTHRPLAATHVNSVRGYTCDQANQLEQVVSGTLTTTFTYVGCL